MKYKFHYYYCQTEKYDEDYQPAYVGYGGNWSDSGSGVDTGSVNFVAPGSFKYTSGKMSASGSGEFNPGGYSVSASVNDKVGNPANKTHKFTVEPDEIEEWLYGPECDTPDDNVAGTASIVNSDATYVADHAKRAMSTFPLCTGHYYGVDAIVEKASETTRAPVLRLLSGHLH